MTAGGTGTAFICATCGTQHAPAAAPPATCVICEDPRQWVPAGGQQWTTMDALARRHAIGWREVTPGLLGCGMFPDFGIAQRALLLRTPAGNVLWDCLALIDPATIAIVKALGGIDAIAISHPHYYASMVDWARAFDCPVLLHAADRRWVMRPDPAIRFWEGETHAVLPGVTLHRLGGHYAGGTILHWSAGQGAILTGDIASVAPDRRHVSFMWSSARRRGGAHGRRARCARLRCRPWRLVGPGDPGGWQGGGARQRRALYPGPVGSGPAGLIDGSRLG